MAEKEIVLSRETVYEGPIFDIEVQQVQLHTGEQTTRDVVRHVPAIAVLAFVDDEHIILEKQWRATVEDFVLEIPAGKLDERDFDDPSAAVQREINEELRMKAGRIQKAIGFVETVGFSDAYMHLYVAHDLTPVPEDEALPRDLGETMDLMTVSFSELKAMFDRGDITDQKTMTAFLYWHYLRSSV